VSGDLSLKGQDSPEVVAKAQNPEDVTLEAKDDQVVIRSSGDCVVRVPRQAYIQVESVDGDATIKAVDGELAIDKVGGDLALRNVANTRLGRVDGDLAAKNVDGTLDIDTLSADATIRGVQADFAISGTCNGNLNLRDVGGSARASADGNIVLHLDPAPGHQYEFTGHANVFCRLPEDASVEISVPKAAQVRVDLPGIHASAPVQTPYALTLGEGDAHLSLTADGNVVLDTHAPDLEVEDFDIDVGADVSEVADVISQQISQQVDSQVRMIEDQLNAQLSGLSMRMSAAGLSEEQSQRIEERAREASERAAARAQEKMRRAQEKMEHKLASMQRKMEMHNRQREHLTRHARHSWGFTIPTPPTPPVAPGEPVSEDERLMILRMLEQKKISMEEAEKLLSTLEGTQ
jgi:hypothetical protein